MNNLPKVYRASVEIKDIESVRNIKDMEIRNDFGINKAGNHIITVMGTDKAFLELRKIAVRIESYKLSPQIET